MWEKCIHTHFLSRLSVWAPGDAGAYPSADWAQGAKMYKALSVTKKQDNNTKLLLNSNHNKISLLVLMNTWYGLKVSRTSPFVSLSYE